MLEEPWPEGVAIVVMGVAGAGKSTIGELLGKRVPCPFIDADDFHSPENREKMRIGVPLTEDDRLPWLEKLRDELGKYTNKGERVVLACSALQPRYRHILLTADPFYRNQDEQQVAEFDTSGVNVKSGVNGWTEHRRQVVFVHLKGSPELFAARLAERHKEGKHFMPASLLQSQLDLLEIKAGDKSIISVDASLRPQDIIDSIKTQLLLMV